MECGERRPWLQPTLRSAPNWSDLPSDPLSEISRRLTLKDYISFRLVCKPWRQAPSTSAFSTDVCSTMLLIYDRNESSSSNNSACFIYNLSEPSLCSTIELPELARSTCMGYKKGWFLLKHDNDQRAFLFNPFCSETIELPSFPPEMSAAGPIMGVFVRYSVCVLCKKFYGNRVVVGLCPIGGKEWEVRSVPREGIASLLEVSVHSTSAPLSQKEAQDLLKSKLGLRALMRKLKVWEKFVEHRPYVKKGFTVEMYRLREMSMTTLPVNDYFLSYKDRYSCRFPSGGDLVEIGEANASTALGERTHG